MKLGKPLFFNCLDASADSPWLSLPDSACLLRAWRLLNGRFFGGKLAPLDIHWSTRLTASLGVFVYNRKRTKIATDRELSRPSRCIRLSQPLFNTLCHDPVRAERELQATIAHEMIHQWQCECLRHRPDHGRTFRAMMETMNREGLQLSIYHGCAEAVARLTRYCWTCLRCGQRYERQRRTINPRRHRCGKCRGSLRLFPDKEGPYRSTAIRVQLSLPLRSP